jgi:flagellar hook-basal body complex protein FliE
MAIDPLTLGQAPLALKPATTPAAPAGPVTGFGEKLQALVEGVEEKTGEANTAVGNMMNKTGDVHEAMIALHKAEMSLQLTVQIRNKLVQAYNDIMRMPV